MKTGLLRTTFLAAGFCIVACGGPPSGVEPTVAALPTPTATPMPPKTFAYGAEFVYPFDEKTGEVGPRRKHGLAALPAATFEAQVALEGQDGGGRFLVGRQHTRPDLGFRSFTTNPETGELSLGSLFDFGQWAASGSSGFAAVAKAGDVVIAVFPTRDHNHTSHTPHLIKAATVDPETGAFSIAPTHIARAAGGWPTIMVPHPSGRWVFTGNGRNDIGVLKVGTNGEVVEHLSVDIRDSARKIFVDPKGGRLVIATSFFLRIMSFDDRAGVLTLDDKLEPDVAGLLTDVAIDPTWTFLSYRDSRRESEVRIAKIDPGPAFGLRDFQTLVAPRPFRATVWAPAGRAFVANQWIFVAQADGTFARAGQIDEEVSFLSLRGTR
jgi:hypothetical protein